MMEKLAALFDLAVNYEKIDINEFGEKLANSDIGKEFEQGNVMVVLGKSSNELLAELLNNTPLDVYQEIETSKEYWVGWVLGYCLFELNTSFNEIFSFISCNELRDLYYPYHEADVNKIKDLVGDILVHTDAVQAFGKVPLKDIKADLISVSSHKIHGPKGVGALYIKKGVRIEPTVFGGGQEKNLRSGTLNVPGIAGLFEGLKFLEREGVEKIGQREHRQVERCAAGLEKLGCQVYSGPHQAGTVSFLPGTDCEEFAQTLGTRGIAVRAGLHCAPLAHESAGTLESGTVRISFGHDAAKWQTDRLLKTLALCRGNVM
jgi:hypothetical protein